MKRTIENTGPFEIRLTKDNGRGNLLLPDGVDHVIISSGSYADFVSCELPPPRGLFRRLWWWLRGRPKRYGWRYDPT